MDGISAGRALRAASVNDLIMVPQKYGTDSSFAGNNLSGVRDQLSQLFAEGDAPVVLTESQRTLLEQWNKLSAEQQNALFALIAVM